MATRQAESLKLVKRIEAVADMGWEVNKTTDGYRVLAPNGFTTAIHLTYSDGRSLINTVKELENQGKLAEDERALKGKRLRERKEKLAAERKAADTKGQLLAARNTAAIKQAAGPYLTQVEDCDLKWLTTPHPSPWARWMYITPQAAEYILENHNSDNRRLSEEQAMRYAKIIVAGQWHLTHQGLAFDTRGLVQDAQHRLRGIVRAGMVQPDIQIPFLVCVGMPVENFVAIDEGRLRTAGQMLAKSGVPGGAAMVTVMRTVAAFDSENPRGFNRGTRFTQVMAHQAWESSPDGWRDAYSVGQRAHRNSGKNVPLGGCAAAHYVICRVNGDNNIYVKAFFEGLIYNRKWRTNLVLPDDDPRAVVLSRFRTAAPKSPLEALCWIVASWNNFVRGHHPLTLRFNEKTPIPNILMCRPGEGMAPRALAGELAGLDEHGNEIDEDDAEDKELIAA